MYRSLISQIVRHFPKQLRVKYPAYSPESVQRHGWELPALRNHFGKAVRSLDSGQAVTIYVDALDECDEDEIRAAIEHFEELRCVPIHICFASRYYPQITIQQCIELNLEDQHEHQNDIRRYIDHKLAIRDVGRKSRLATEIKARSSGVFLWVVLVVRLIWKKSDNGALYSELLHTLHEVPSELEYLIGVILESPDAGLLCALRWVLFAYRRLTVPELYFAIRVSTCQISSGAYDPAEANIDDMEAFVLASSRGLIENTAPHRPGEKHRRRYSRVQLVHESVREYLLAGGLVTLGLCSDKIVQASMHAELYRCCQTYLGLISGEMTAIIKHSITPHRPLDATYPLFEYSSLFVLEHFEDSLNAGLLCLCSLRDLALDAVMYLQHLYDVPLQQQLLEPHRHASSLLYLAISKDHKELAEAIIVADATFHNAPNDNIPANTGAHVCEFPRGGIDINTHFEHRWSSLLVASLERCPEITELLLDRGAHFNADLEFAVGECGKKVVQLLLSRARIHDPIAQDQTNALLIHAASKLNVEVVEHFLQTSLGVGVKVQALEAALLASDHEYDRWRQRDMRAGDARQRIVQLLLDAAVDMTESCVDFRTQALSAILRSTDWKLWHYDGQRMVPGTFRLLAVKQLLGIGGDIDFDFDGLEGNCETALIAAAAVGQSDLVKHLLEHGADPHHRSARYGRAVDVAFRRGHTEVVSVLQAASTAPIGPSSTRMILSASERPSTQL